jgi:hypothetical protein
MDNLQQVNVLLPEVDARDFRETARRDGISQAQLLSKLLVAGKIVDTYGIPPKARRDRFFGDSKLDSNSV